MRLSKGVALAALRSTALVLVLLAGVPAVAADAKERLDQAIKRFDDGDYLAAQELLAGIDRAELSPDQQKVRDDYLNRVQVALNMYEKALRDLEDAETAIAAKETDRAKGLLEKVLANEYAAEALRRSASAHLRDLAREPKPKEGEAAAPKAAAPPTPTRAETMQAGMEPKPAPAQPQATAPAPAPAPPPGAARVGSATDRARQLTREGEELTRAGRYDDAEQRFQEALASVPGFPEAMDGLATLRQHLENQSGARGQSLADRIRAEDSINWQRTTVQYRDAERVVREQVAAERFEEADQTLTRARQIVESGKQFADPVVKYENLRSELEALATYVATAERAFHERKVAETRREIEEQRSARLREVEENRARQVEALMQQALQHRKDGDLAAAVNVLRQVTVIDPKHAPARWLMDILEEQRQYHRQRELRDDFYDQARGALTDVEEAKIPWYQELSYAKDWPEILARPGRTRPGQSRPDRLLLSALDRPVPVDFKRVPFGEVLERLAQAHQLNIIVNWNDLQRAGVDRNAPIELVLPNEITLKKVLTEVLDQAGAGSADVDFDVADGAITVATRQHLDRETFAKVYDISDLLMDVPSFRDAPNLDLRHTTSRTPPAAEQGALPWKYGDDDDDEPESDPQRLDRVQKVIQLIEETVAPDSWRDRGGSIGTIKEINGQLVITQNAAAHRTITGLLDRLREERAIQVAVEALFITVSSHYLEEMGIDLDIVLNNGNAGFDFLDSGNGPLTDPVLGNRLLLPRTFSRLGFTPNIPAQGTQLAQGAAVGQPAGHPFLIPPQVGGSGSQLTPVPIATSTLDLTNPANLPSDVPGSFGGQAIAPALSVFGSFLDNIQVDFLIRATQADSRTTVLTAPRLVVFNGGSAWIAVTIQQNFVSQLQPVVAQQAVAQAPVTNTIDAGASLFVRATVTADKRYVMMLLAPGVTRLLDLQTFQFSGGTGANQAFIQLPTLSTQRIQTMVSVPDGGTLLIGGQKLASETEVDAGVPILSKIPVLKRLYSSRSLIKDEQTLLILIKPKILIHSEQEEIAFPAMSSKG
ncbi:MAG: hypothetical protein HY763_11910 [Planctomycetes bacterium]|nr:hypothetical protein [Planctomycetota bacterium]